MSKINFNKGSCRTLFPRFCKEGTILGLKYLYLYPDKPSRCFWCIFLCFVLYLALLLTYLLYRRFEAMPTRITIENQFEPAASLPYPAITLCSPNQMTLRALKHFDETLVYVSGSKDQRGVPFVIVNNGDRAGINLTEVVPQTIGFFHFIKSNPQSLAILQRLIDVNRYTIPEVLVLLPQSCEDFLQMCIFRQEPFPRCRGLFRPLLTKWGLCCSFNSVYHYKTNRRNERDRDFSPHLVGRSGIQHGLSVVTDYRPQTAVDHTIHFAGATKVMFTDWTEFPTDDESILIAPDTESFHFIHATVTYCSEGVRELHSSSRKCAFEDEKTLPFFWHYRNSDCDLLCIVQAVEDRCKCLMFYLPHLRTTQTCLLTHMTCITDTKLKLNDWLQQKKCECPRDCDSRVYNVDVTVGNLKARQYMLYPEAWTSQSNDSDNNTSTSIMHFFFHTPVYEKLKQETVMSYTTLASNLGGVFGLCMGVSLISLLEIWFFEYVCVRNCLRRRSERRKRTRKYTPPPRVDGDLYYGHIDRYFE